MQAWQQVQVTNDNSQHAKRAGYVLRVEGTQDKPVIVAKLDEVTDPVSFDPAELRVL